MIVDLHSISSAARRFDFTLQPEWWKPDGRFDQVLGPAGGIDVRMSIYRAGSRFVLDGGVSGKLRACCDRCLENFETDIVTGFRLYLDFQPADQSQEEIELGEEDMGVDFVNGDEVDLASVAREQIHLALPMKILCNERCAGLCPGCGANLNREPCRCQGPGVACFPRFEPIEK